MQGMHSSGENTDSLENNKNFSRRRLKNLKKNFQTVGTLQGSMLAGDPEQGSEVAEQASKAYMYLS